MQGMAFILFAVFALVLVGLYLAIRREWLRPGLTAGIGVALSIILMALISLAQNNPPIQAVIVGVVLGAAFSGATLAVAWYFHSQERRASFAQGEPYDEG
ncbi:MAG: hypothetical protein H6671_08885 [Anaerolineaceae bacterium]|nr:hypothetical protein [Anaerolineaceae bacterium]